MTLPMDDITRQKLKNECLENLRSYQLSSAFETLQALTVRCSSDELKMLCQTLVDNYFSMLKFILSAGKDKDCEQRQFVFIQEAARLLMQTDRILRIDKNTDAYSKIYNSLKEKYGDNIDDTLMRKWRECTDPLEQSALEDSIFHLLFTSPLWRRSDTAKWYDFLTLQNRDVEQHLIGALFLSVWEYPDVEKMRLLYECAYGSGEDTLLETTAVSCLLLLAHRHKDFPFMDKSVFKNIGHGRLAHYIPELQRELARMSLSLLYWKEEQKEVLELSSKGVDIMEYVAKTMEIKLRFEKKRIEKSLDSGMDLASQMCHSSVYLKDVSHWFAPIRLYSPIVLEAVSGTDDDTIAKLIEKTSKMWCDIDTVCFIDIISNAKMKGRLGKMIESAGDIAGVPDIHLSPMSRTVRNLQRFFAHSLFSGDRNVLEQVVLWELPYLHASFTDEDKLETALTLHSAKRYADALELFNELLHSIRCDAPFLAQMAECEKDAGNVNAALQHFRQAELLDEDNIAYLAEIQECLSRLGRNEDRLAMLKRMCSLVPDNLGILRELCVLLAKTGHYDEALKTVTERISDDFGDDVSFFTIAMYCALSSKRMDTARHYLGVLAKHDKLSSQDMSLWTGYLHIADGNWKEALPCFRNTMEDIQDRKERVKYFNQTISRITNFGVNRKELSLIRDIVLASFDT